MEPLEKCLKARIRENGFHVVERVAQLIMTPGFMDEILA
jgi:hypothetical protein